MNNEQEYAFPKVEIIIDGKSIKPDNLWELLSGLERSLKDADVIDYDYTLDILSKEASAVVDKCGY